jgi:hypothetical protein
MGEGLEPSHTDSRSSRSGGWAGPLVCRARAWATNRWARRATAARLEGRRPESLRAPRIRRGPSPPGTYGGGEPARIESNRQKTLRELRFTAPVEGQLCEPTTRPVPQAARPPASYEYTTADHELERMGKLFIHRRGARPMNAPSRPSDRGSAGDGRRQAPDRPPPGAPRSPSTADRPGLSRSTERAGNGRRHRSGGVGASAAFPDERKGLETGDPDPHPPPGPGPAPGGGHVAADDLPAAGAEGRGPDEGPH